MRRLRAPEIKGNLALELRSLVGSAKGAGFVEAAEYLIALLETRVVQGRPSVGSGEAYDQRKAMLDRDGWRCRNTWCRSHKNLQVDHIIPRSQQGPDDEGNLWTLCAECHQFKETGVYVPVQDQRTGAWLLVDTRRAVRCAECHRTSLRGERWVVPTTGGLFLEIETNGPYAPPAPPEPWTAS
jgi:hypothetical protein